MSMQKVRRPHRAPLVCQVKHALGIVSPSMFGRPGKCFFGLLPNRPECDGCRERLTRPPMPDVTKIIYAPDGTIYVQDPDRQGWTGHPETGCFDEWD